MLHRKVPKKKKKKKTDLSLLGQEPIFNSVGCLSFAGCLKGTYGPNCAKNCSEGCVNSTCLPDDGKCSECVESYIGAKCDTKGKELSSMFKM